MSVRAEAVDFRPLAEADLPLIHRWLNNPEVARWYGIDPYNLKYPSLDQVSGFYLPRINREKPTRCYVINRDDDPVGYIQCYRVGDYPEYARALDLDDDAIGIDVFIGEDSARGGGMGATVLSRFLALEVFAHPEARTAVIAPDPANLRAVRCYEKAGFRPVKTVWVPEENGYERVMVLHRAVDSTR